MPPKRKKPSTTTNSTTSKPRRSRLARENDLTADQESEIRAAFELFIQDSSTNSPSTSASPAAAADDDTIATADFRRCLIALSLAPASRAELHELVETVDPENSGVVPYASFVAIAALKLHQLRPSSSAASRGAAGHHDDDDEAVTREQEELDRAFGLFTKGADREISLGDLRRVAKELREDVPESVLRDMIREATGGGVGPVGREEFGDVMRRAGVFG